MKPRQIKKISFVDHVSQVDLDELFRQSPAFFAVLRGPEYVFEKANDAYLQLVGRRDILGKPLFQALPEVVGQGFERLLDSVVESKRPFTAKAMGATLQRTPGGPTEQVYVDFIFQPLIGSNGEVIGLIVHGSDVTEQVLARQAAEERALALYNAETILRESEDQLRTALNSIPTLAWMANADGWIFWYNSRWYEYSGTTPDQMEGWGWQSVHDPEILPSVLDRWNASIRTGEAFEMEFPLRSATGEFRWFLTRVVPSRDSEGRIQRWFGTNTDVHIQREAGEAARAANKAKSDFLAAMSHETRQPINATLGFLDVIAMGAYGEITDAQRDALARVRINQEQLLALITDILSFARLEAGRIQLRQEVVSCGEIFEALEALVAQQVQARQITLTIETCNGDLKALGDRNRILQVLTNLVTNAARATEAGGKIVLRARRDADTTVFEVEDTGRGIPKDKLDEIFAPFVQLDRALNNPRDGVGLGLAISRDLTKAMHGTLSVRSEVDVGSVFSLSLPAAFPG